MATQFIRTDAFSAALKDLLKSNSGKFFTVEFVKKDGSVRTMTCQQGYFKGHDEANPVAHIEKYLTVKEVSTGAFKNVNCETIRKITMAGTTLIVRDNDEE